jgi:hypothetical protein
MSNFNVHLENVSIVGGNAMETTIVEMEKKTSRPVMKKIA